MLLTSTTVNGAVSNDSNNNITMSVGNTVIANVNSSGIFFESGKKAIYTGAVLQVVNVTNNTLYVGSAGAETVLFTFSITPSSATSKIGVFVSLNTGVQGTFTNYAVFYRLRRGTTTAGTDLGAFRFGQFQGSGGVSRELYTSSPFSILDSPNTTSPQSYCITVANLDGNPTYAVNSNGGTSSINLLEIAV